MTTATAAPEPPADLSAATRAAVRLASSLGLSPGSVRPVRRNFGGPAWYALDVPAGHTVGRTWMGFPVLVRARGKDLVNT